MLICMGSKTKKSTLFTPDKGGQKGVFSPLPPEVGRDFRGYFVSKTQIQNLKTLN